MKHESIWSAFNRSFSFYCTYRTRYIWQSLRPQCSQILVKESSVDFTPFSSNLGLHSGNGSKAKHISLSHHRGGEREGKQEEEKKKKETKKKKGEEEKQEVASLEFPSCSCSRRPTPSSNKLRKPCSIVSGLLAKWAFLKLSKQLSHKWETSQNSAHWKTCQSGRKLLCGKFRRTFVEIVVFFAWQ